MPVYNAEKYLRTALDSIINQTYKNIEIVCVDDGSNDSSPSILHEYKAKDSRIHILRQQNQYAGIARNNGMAHATGDYIMFLDSDDILERKAVAYLVNKAEKLDTDIIVFGYYMFLNQTKGRRPVKNKYKNRTVCSAEDIKDNIFQITRSLPWDKLIKTEFLKSTGLKYQDMRVSEDIFVNRMMVTEAKRLLFSGKRLINYRIGNDDSLQGKINRYPAEFLKGNIAIYNELVKNRSYHTFKRSFEQMIVDDMIMHLKSIDSYDHFAEIVRTANNMKYWETLQIDSTTGAVENSNFKQTLELLLAGRINDSLAKLYCETSNMSIGKNSIEYLIGHSILKVLHLTYN